MSPSEIPPATDAGRIRPAQRTDVPAMLAIYNHAIRHTTATYDYEPRTLEQRFEWFDGDNHVCLSKWNQVGGNRFM